MSVGPPAGRVAGPGHQLGLQGRTPGVGWGCWPCPGRLSAYVPAGAEPLSHPLYRLPDRLQAATIAVVAGSRPAGCHGPGSRNRGDWRGKKEPGPPAFGGPRLNLSPSHRVTDLQTPHPLGAPLLGPLCQIPHKPAGI